MSALVVAPCRFEADPRHEYWATTLEKWGNNVFRVELLDSIKSVSTALRVVIEDGNVTAASNRKSTGKYELLSGVKQVTSSPLGRVILGRALRLIAAAEQLSSCLEEPSSIVANDLLAAIAIHVVWPDRRIRTIYDAHEVFVESYDVLGGPTLTKAERAAWIQLESAVCSRTSVNVTVSDGIADLFRRRHHAGFRVIPNFVPRTSHAHFNSFRSQRPVHFVMIGRPDPHRGLEKLVTSWDVDPARAELHLFLTEGPQLRRLKNASSSTERRFAGPKFMAPVKPRAIIETLAAYDVGILPYEFPYPYSYASPNKLGEYLAAGLPVLVNHQPFSANLVERYGIGRVFDWSVPSSFSNAVEEMCDSGALTTARRAVQESRSSQLNWEYFVDGLAPLLEKKASAEPSVLVKIPGREVRSSLWEALAWMMRVAVLSSGRWGFARLAGRNSLTRFQRVRRSFWR